MYSGNNHNTSNSNLSAPGYSNGKRMSTLGGATSGGPIGPPPGVPPKRKPIKRVPVGGQPPPPPPPPPSHPDAFGNNTGNLSATSQYSTPVQSLESLQSTSNQSIPPSKHSPFSTPSPEANESRRFSPSPDQQFPHQAQPPKTKKLPYPEDEMVPKVRPAHAYQEARPPPPLSKPSSNASSSKINNFSQEDLRAPPRTSSPQRASSPRQSPPSPSSLPADQGFDFRQPHDVREMPPTSSNNYNNNTSVQLPPQQQPPPFQPQHTSQHQNISQGSLPGGPLNGPQLAASLPPHQRSGSVHSQSSIMTSASQQQPLYMNTNNNLSALTTTGSTNLQHQYSVSHSSVYSQSSKVSGSGPISDLGIGTGSAYVKELRKRLGTAWCDVPSRQWGLPIGISGKSSASISALGPTKNFQRRAMDIRHSHLRPRLLASEVEDDDDTLESPSSSHSTGAGTIGAGGTGGYNNTKSSASSIINNTSPGDHSNSNNGTNSSKYDDLSLRDPESSILESPNRQRERSVSESSTKSVDEGVGKIRLFVANPDSDSD